MKTKQNDLKLSHGTISSITKQILYRVNEHMNSCHAETGIPTIVDWHGLSREIEGTIDDAVNNP